MLQIGDKVKQVVYMGEKHCTDVGKVVYIHPECRFYMLEFEGKNGLVRECYHFEVKEQAAPEGRTKWAN